ncbi:hypothetical protein [Microcoleus sp. FACHB-672]|nr:hypothetical protein [Microcoleus sp. FACHB-672]
MKYSDISNRNNVVLTGSLNEVAGLNWPKLHEFGAIKEIRC